MSPPTCRRCHVRDAAFRGSRSTRRKIGWLVRNVESNVESLRAFFLVTCSPRDKRSGRWIRREDEGGRRKGRDFGAVQVLFSFIAEAQPVARFAACFTIYTFVSRTDDKRSSSPRVAIARREMGRGEKNPRYSRGMRGGIGVMDHDLTRSESGWKVASTSPEKFARCDFLCILILSLYDRYFPLRVNASDIYLVHFFSLFLREGRGDFY